jgi:amidase
MVLNTAPFDVTGHPAISVPCQPHGSLPIGMMLVGRHFADAAVLRVAAAVEELHGGRHDQSSINGL